MNGRDRPEAVSETRLNESAARIPPTSDRRDDLLALISALPQDAAWSFRRNKDGRLGRATSVATARRHYRTGRWVADEDALSNARCLAFLSSPRFDQLVAEKWRRSFTVEPGDAT